MIYYWSCNLLDHILYNQYIARNMVYLNITWLKEGRRVRQKHNCLVILFIAAIATTCFGRAWPSSGHVVDVYKWEKTRFCLVWTPLSGVHTRQNSTHPQPAEALTAGTSPTPDFSYSNRSSEPPRHRVFSHLYTSTCWPEDGQARPKHVVAIAAINRITRQLCFWRTLLPSFNIRKHNGDDEPEDYHVVIWTNSSSTTVETRGVEGCFWSDMQLWHRIVGCGYGKLSAFAILQSKGL
jgi:hypothetical protein